MIGRTLGHYRIVEKIGRGGMGEVYRARDERLERDVALKVLPAGMLADEAARRRFRKEALALSKLNHPNIQTVHDFDTQDGIDFLVTEYVPGVTLNDKLKSGPLSEKEILKLGAQMAEGLAAAHSENIVHRDIKPGNVRVTPEDRLKILDFGLAKHMKPAAEAITTDSLSESEVVVGTLPYMAPEQLRGEPVDARTDIYAVGTVLYEMAVGRRPFQEKQPSILKADIQTTSPVPPGRLNPEISPRLEETILRCLEKDPEHRYQSSHDLLAEFRRLISGRGEISPERSAKPTDGMVQIDAHLVFQTQKRQAYRDLWERLEEAHVKLRVDSSVNFPELVRDLNSFALRHSLYLEEKDRKWANRYLQALQTLTKLVFESGDKEAIDRWTETNTVPIGENTVMALAIEEVQRLRTKLLNRVREVIANTGESRLHRTEPKKNKDLPSVAVLPFADMSPRKDQEYFCDGMTEEIINTLTQVQGLLVVSRTSVFQFKNRTQDIRMIGKELSVQTVVEGSVRKADSKLRITAQLVNVADGYHLWSERFDRNMQDLFAIQDEISEAIASKLKQRLKLETTGGDELDQFDIALDVPPTKALESGLSGVEQTLRERIRQPLDIEEFLRLAGQCAEALAEAHNKGILHCDIRPENIGITATGKLRLLDFGLDYKLDKGLPRRFSSPAYASPEVIRGEKADGRGDIFSLGVVFYEALSGLNPFLHPSYTQTMFNIVKKVPSPVSKVNRRVPIELDRIIAKMLAKEPADRYATARDLVVDLCSVQGRLAITPAVKPLARATWLGRIGSPIGSPSIQTRLWRRLQKYTFGVPEPKPEVVGRKKVKKVSKRWSRMLAAHDVYLKGRYCFNQGTAEGWRNAAQYYNEAIARDRTYARAYAGLAEAYTLLGVYGESTPKQVMPMAKSVAEFALEIDDTISEAYLSLGICRLHYYLDWVATEREFRRALKLNPGSAIAHHWQALYETSLGQFDSAIAEMKRALELDPLSPRLNTSLGWILLVAGQYQEGEQQLRKTLEKDASFCAAHTTLANVYLQEGKFEQAFAEFEEARPLCGDSPGYVAKLATAYAAAGKTGEARKALAQLEGLESQRYVSPYSIAWVYSGLNEKDQAVQWLEKAYAERDVSMIYLNIDQQFAALRDHPGFDGLLRRLSFPTEASPR